MSFTHSKDSRFAFGSTALAAYLTGFTTSTMVDTADATDITSATRNYVPGLTDSTIAASGLFESLYDTPAVAALGAASGSPVTVAPAGFALGNPVIVVSGREISYEVSGAVGEVVAANINIQGDGRFDSGVSLIDLAEVTATGTGSVHTAAAGTSNGGVGTIHVTACSGTLTVKIQHSTNNSTWSDLLTFTAATGATSERVVVSGAVNKYLRASYTLTGVGAAATFTTNLARR